MAQLKSGSTVGGVAIATTSTFTGGRGIDLSSTTFNVAFDSTAAEGVTKNNSGVISIYASGAWRQVYTAVYS